MQKNENKAVTRPAGLPRRLMAMIYDSLLLAAILMVAALPPVLLAGGAMPNPLARLVFQLYLGGIAFLFFSWFWVHGGQTLGMRAWRLKVVALNGQTVGWQTALIRFLFALVSAASLGLGYLWVLIDPERRAWHDRISKSRVVVLPKIKKHGLNDSSHQDDGE